MWEKLLDRFLSGFMVRDRLEITYPDGTTRRYGPDQGGETAAMEIRDSATLRALCLNPELTLGEGYMNDRIALRNTSLEGLLRVAFRNRQAGQLAGWLRGIEAVRYRLRHFTMMNAPSAARRNVAHHYDISDDLYRRFLDSDMQYSCAYWERDDVTLEQAQLAKKHMIARKLRIEPGMHVLDIGCGWGGMALTLARDYGARVTGITLSENQLATAQARAEAEGLSDRIHFELRDYRHVKGPFDRIVSVGMLEHVGVPNYGTYFNRVAELLDRDGVALVHTIARSAPPTTQSPWITKYIFPGGYVPSLSELATPMENAGLWQTDIEIWRLHYAKTLWAWRERFETQLDWVRQHYDERFIRMWRFYLTACAVAFEEQAQAVYQFQLAHRVDAVPITRDYLYPAQETHAPAPAAAKGGSPTSKRLQNA